MRSQEISRPASTATTIAHFDLVVNNVPPTITSFVGTDVDANSTATVTAAISDAPHDTFFVTIRWGVSTIGFSQLTNLNHLGPGLATLFASNQFLIAPDPANPAAPISIIMEVADDDGGVTTQTIVVRVPGTGIPTVNVRESGIETSRIPIAVYIPPQNTDARPYTVAVQPGTDTGRVIVDRVAVSTRSVLLRIVSARRRIVGYVPSRRRSSRRYSGVLAQAARRPLSALSLGKRVHARSPLDRRRRVPRSSRIARRYAGRSPADARSGRRAEAPGR
ncbi:MAG: hypothetical protein QM775_10685 [Pirellulales bacterium]